MNVVAQDHRQVDRAGTFDGFISYSHAGDGLVAPRLQAALQRFAKPWWRRRALHVFRDESSLSANPHLWSSITDALASSEWFVLLTSPEAAQSEWVDREVAWWVHHKDPNRILPVLTDGDIDWDPAAARLSSSSSVPPSLVDAFNEEPRWVDLRWARRETDLDLRNSRFRSAVADIASTLRGVAKDELESEEVRQHRRTLRTAWSAAALLVALTVTTTLVAVYADAQRQEAVQQTQIALESEARAEAEAERATSAEALARSRELAASAINVLDQDPELSILLGLEAIDTAPPGSDIPIEAESALREAVHTSRLRNRIPISQEAGHTQIALSPDGSSLAVLLEADAVVRMYDTESWAVTWEYAEAGTVDNFLGLSYAPSGGQLALAIVDSTSYHAIVPRGTEDDLGARVVILDAESGDAIRTLEFGPCPSVEVSPYAPDGRLLPVTVGTGSGCDGEFGPESEGWRVELLDTATWDVAATFPTTFLAKASWSADGSRLAVTSYDATGANVFDMNEGTVVGRIEGVFLGELSPDGTLLAGYRGAGNSLEMYDVESNEIVDRLTGLADLPNDAGFSRDGQYLIASSRGRHAAVWDTFTGELVDHLPVAAASIDVAFDDATQEVYLATETEITVWDISGAVEGELDSLSSGQWINANSIAVNREFGAVIAVDLAAGLPAVWPFDAGTGELGPERFPTYQTVAPAVLPDGRLVFTGRRGGREEPDSAIGGAVVWNPADGSVEHVAGCWVNAESFFSTPPSEPPTCDEPGESWFLSDTVFTDPTGSMLLISGSPDYAVAASDLPKEVRLLDSRTLEPLRTFDLPEQFAAVVGFAGDWIVASETDVVAPGADEELGVVDLQTNEVLLTMLGSETEISRDGTLLAVSSISGDVTIYDAGRWAIRVSVGAEEARVRGLAFSPDGSKLMTAATDDFVRIWDTTTGVEVARIPLTGASDGHWRDESHVVVGTSEGLWTTLTLDIEELRDLAESRRTRSFDVEECAAYLIEPCPAP